MAKNGRKWLENMLKQTQKNFENKVQKENNCKIATISTEKCKKTAENGANWPPQHRICIDSP